MEGSKFSLSFSKVIEKKILQPSALKPVKEKRKEIQEEIIESIEENVIKSNAPQQQELVIPLLQRDKEPSVLAKTKQREKQQTEENQNSKGRDNSDRVLSLEEKAEQALLAEAADPSIQRQHTPSDVSIQSLDEDKKSTLGSIPTLDDFEEVGVNDFGAAMLRGMGWKKGGGVGNARNRKVVSIIEASNKTLGSSTASRSKAALRDQGIQEGEDQLVLKKGSYALISAGRHKGSYGIVESVEEDHVLLRKAVGGAVVREVEANLTLVTKEHYSESSRVINKEMFDKFKENELSKNKKSSGPSTRKNESEENHSDEDRTYEQRDKRSSNFNTGGEDEIKHKNRSVNRRPDENSTARGSGGHKSYPKSSDLLATKDPEEVDRDRNVNAIKEEPKTEFSESSNQTKSETHVGEINSSDNKRDVKVSEAQSHYQRLQDAVLSHKAKKDQDNSHLDSKRRDRSEKYDSRRSKDFGEPRSKRHHGRSSPDRDEQPYKKAYLEKEELYKSSNVEHHFRKGDKSKPSTKENHSKEQYLLSKYGDASIKADQDPTSRSARAAPWVREGLTVRITSESFKGGKYFKEKVVVENVVTAVQCECRTSQGKLLSHVPPDILETVIPKLPPRTVMVVKGRHSGMLGRVLEQHKSAQEASVQLLEDRSQILRLHYEQICQYGA